MKLALGTVQFGLKYGVSNGAGKVPEDEVRTILQVARAAGIDTLDTAVGYGDSEAVLGRANVGGFQLISKLPELPAECGSIKAWLVDETRASLGRLGISRLGALLLHEPGDLLGARGTDYQAALQYIKSEGLVEAVGVSVSNPGELESIISLWHPDIIQIPFNVMDRRLIRSGWLARLRESGVRVHVRSAFLQGLLLMPRDSRPAYFQPWAPLLNSWHDWCATHGVTPLQAALSLPLSQGDVERVVFGVESSAQLSQIVEASRAVIPPLPDDLFSDDPALLEPFRWRFK